MSAESDGHGNSLQCSHGLTDFKMVGTSMHLGMRGDGKGSCRGGVGVVTLCAVDDLVLGEV